MYHCFSCGAGGDVFKFVMDYENLTFPEAVKVLADRAGIELPEQEHKTTAIAKRHAVFVKRVAINLSVLFKHN